ncbi:hypothetical protein BU23DRAFT_551947 [Bimuria novae-zelandiae CBS 107.79]|uniref:BTB domain-containing protein n=1 Tax=Bimuria novae-zelandiae CBS 107.79 TaxID=1447943 RepID=A0A6A5VFU2_9PLEO|nr:hypothetical protein BU23DRAFT_551947 [Bimuria novae-zelandiae CBS 107.79]
MPIVEHYVDPHPDAVIVLRNPCIDFAPWGEALDSEVSTIESLVQLISITPSLAEPGIAERIQDDGWGDGRGIAGVHSKKKKSKKGFSRTINEIETTVENDTIGENPAGASGEPSSSTQAKEDSESAVETPMNNESESQADDFFYYVSSHILSLASPWFRRSLTNEQWTESERDEKDGLFHITVEGWDSDTLLLLLNILHLQNRKVPRRISLERLAKFALLVDYYECAEAVEVFSQMWVTYLAKATPTPSTYCRDLIFWIWVSWVFNQTYEFKNATRTAVKQCSEPIRTLGLPIPDKVLDKINLQRYEVIEQVIESFSGLRQRYESLDYVCPQNSAHSFACGSMLYGAISKAMKSIRILSPRPQVPFAGISFQKLCSDAGKIRFPFWSSHGGNHSGFHDFQETCHLTAPVTTIIDNVTSTVIGFDLESFKEPKPASA